MTLEISTKEGGDSAGGNLRSATYSANLLNQYTNRTVSGTADIIGIAKPDATVTVNSQSTYRRGEYYHAAITNDNTSAILYTGYTNRAVLSADTNIVTGNLLIPKTPQSFWYDLDGNLLSDGVWTNIWDAENRMSATENTTGVPSIGRAKETWAFDDQGRWVQRIVLTWSGASYVPQYTNGCNWDNTSLRAILGDSAVVKASFMRGIDLSLGVQSVGGSGSLLAVKLQTNGVLFCAYDGNANVVGLTKGTDGSDSGAYEYDPFGRALRATESAAKDNPIRFSSQLEDGVTLVKKYLYRDLSTEFARWTSRDPMTEAGGVSIYGFAGNDAVNATDFLGLFCCNGRWYNPFTHCCKHGTVISREPVDTGLKHCSAPTQTEPKVDHEWIEGPGWSAGFYPNGATDGSLPGQVRDPDPASGRANKKCNPIKLSRCQFNISAFITCIRQYVTSTAANPPMYQTVPIVGHNCVTWLNAGQNDCMRTAMCPAEEIPEQ